MSTEAWYWQQRADLESRLAVIEHEQRMSDLAEIKQATLARLGGANEPGEPEAQEPQP